MPCSIEHPGIAGITGAASGLGRAFALLLAEHGWTLELSDIDETGNRDTANICAAQGAEVFTTTVDTSVENDIRIWCNDIYKRHGQCSLLINNAGVAGAGEIGQLSLELWEWVLQINLLGPIYACHHFVPRMRQANHGHIVNISSIASFTSVPSLGPYNVAKSGVVSLSETLHAELKGTGVGVTVASPSLFNTSIKKHTRTSTKTGQRKLIDQLISESRVSSDMVAKKIIAAVEQDELYAFPQPDARALWWLRRLLPRTFGRVVSYAINQLSEKPDDSL